MQERIAEIQAQYAELTAQLGDPDIASDPKAYRQIVTTQKQLEPIARLAEELRRRRPRRLLLLGNCLAARVGRHAHNWPRRLAAGREAMRECQAAGARQERGHEAAAEHGSSRGAERSYTFDDDTRGFS